MFLLIFVSMSILLIFTPTIFGAENMVQLKLLKKDFLRPNKLLVEIYYCVNNRFKRMLQSSFRVVFPWTIGLILFIIGFCSWMVQNNVSYQISASISTVFCSLALYYRLSSIDTDFI